MRIWWQLFPVFYGTTSRFVDQMRAFPISESPSLLYYSVKNKIGLLLIPLNQELIKGFLHEEETQTFQGSNFLRKKRTKLRFRALAFVATFRLDYEDPWIYLLFLIALTELSVPKNEHPFCIRTKLWEEFVGKKSLHFVWQKTIISKALKTYFEIKQLQLINGKIDRKIKKQSRVQKGGNEKPSNECTNLLHRGSNLCTHARTMTERVHTRT